MMTNDEIMDIPMREAVRMMDSMESENGCVCEKSVENYNSIEKEARNVFPNGLSAVALKCAFGLSMCGKGSAKSMNW